MQQTSVSSVVLFHKHPYPLSFPSLRPASLCNSNCVAAFSERGRVSKKQVFQFDICELLRCVNVVQQGLLQLDLVLMQVHYLLL